MTIEHINDAIESAFASARREIPYYDSEAKIKLMQEEVKRFLRLIKDIDEWVNS